MSFEKNVFYSCAMCARAHFIKTGTVRCRSDRTCSSEHGHVAVPYPLFGFNRNGEQVSAVRTVRYSGR